MTVRKGLISVHELLDRGDEGKSSLCWIGINHKKKGEIIDEENGTRNESILGLYWDERATN